MGLENECAEPCEQWRAGSSCGREGQLFVHNSDLVIR